jgi:hypothetical protein
MSLGLCEFDEAIKEAISELSITEILKVEEYKKMAQGVPKEVKTVLLSVMELALDTVVKGDNWDEDELKMCFMRYATDELRYPESAITPLKLKEMCKN